MSKLNELIENLCPNGVEYKKFNDIAYYIRGVTYKKYDEVKQGNNGYKLLRANNITLESNTINFNDIKIIDFSVKVKDSQLLKKNDILICAGSGSKAHIGKVAYIFKDMNYTFGGFMGVIRVNKQLITPRYLFHIMTSPIFKNHLEKVLKTSTINNINNDTWVDFKIPVPPLEIQCEIVRILDKFTELLSFLRAELKARKKQYAYYRDKLFELSQNIEYLPLEKIAEIGTGSSNTNQAVENGIYPFFVRSQQLYRKNTFEFDETAIITAGDGDVGKIFHYIEGKYALHQRAYRIHIINPRVIPKYFYYYMKAKFYDYIMKNAFNSSVTSIRKPMLNSFLVPIIEKNEQEKIITILDNFDKLTNSFTEGIPAEIEARQKQYEYYRDKLLTFKELKKE